MIFVKQGNLKKMIVGAVFCALVFAATCISIPVGFGNLNLGDGMLLVGAWMLGGAWSVVAAGVGASLSDVVAGYGIYAPATAVIKVLMAVVAIATERWLRGTRLSVGVRRLISAACAEAIMIGGYLVYEAFILGYGAAALPGAAFNLLQGVLAAVVSMLSCQLLDKAGIKFS